MRGLRARVGHPAVGVTAVRVDQQDVEGPAVLDRGETSVGRKRRELKRDVGIGQPVCQVRQRRPTLIRQQGALHTRDVGQVRVREAAETGLTGGQGVMIPAANVKNLMLKKSVIEAVRQKQFTIWQVSTIEEGIEILLFHHLF